MKHYQLNDCHQYLVFYKQNVTNVIDFDLLSSMLCFQVVQDALDKANLTEADLSAVAVTIGPGLSLCLRGTIVIYIYIYLYMYIFVVE